MPRAPRFIVPGVPHHVITRGNNRRRLFSYPRDRDLFIRLLGKGLRLKNCSSYALTLLTNHVHAMTTPLGESSMPAWVKYFSQRYAQHRNRDRNGSGKLFEQSYFSKVIKTEAQLAITTMYIEANPLRAGIVTDPLDYRWSTYPIHAGQPALSAVPIDYWTPSGWYMSLGNTATERADCYRRLFADYAKREVTPEHVDECVRFEKSGYAHSERRPDRTRATEASPRYGID